MSLTAGFPLPTGMDQQEGSLKAHNYQQSEYELTGKEAELQSRVGKRENRKVD